MAVMDLERNDTATEFSCEIAIVGAGAVGIAMAVELWRRGHDVILLEAGGLSLEAQSQNIFTNARSSGFKLDGLHSGRFRLLGGTTNFWGGQLVPFDPIVFEDRPWLPVAGWPFGRDALQPYYEQAMSLIGMDGCHPDDGTVWRRAKTCVPELGDDLEMFLTRWARTPNFAKLFKADLAAAAARVLIHANVVGFEPAGAGRRVGRVHVRSFNKRSAVISARRVILACGTVEISRLLMLPYADGGATPWGQNPWLGRAYVDHLDSTAGEVVPLDREAFQKLFDNLFIDGYKYNPKIKLSEQAQREKGLLGVAASFIYRTSYQEHIESLRFFCRSIRDGKLPADVWRMPGHVLSLLKVAAPFAVRHFQVNRMFRPSNSAILFRVTVEQIPQTESRIRLRHERDELGMPMVDVRWVVNGREVETISYFARQVRDQLRRAGLADLRLNPKLVANDHTYLDDASDTYHQMGGTRMGADASQGVVDENLAVFGVENLYVAGAAVFPTTGFANCTLTAIALGLRLCDHLVRENVPSFEQVA